ncbi:MAG: glycine--tRNA ligase [Candidatus Altiarchaeota archaeon]|nr:glycine--tRNA ligase [Candidatus Altiarchaeota archaeon]
MVKLSELQKFLVDKAIIFPTAEMYGSFAGFFDYGPLGVEMKRAVKNEWWNHFVRGRSDTVGMDGSIITHPKVWEASGHVDAFHDPLVECKKCKTRTRADHLIEDRLKITAEGMELKDVATLIREHDLTCPKCGSHDLIDPRYFELMFSTEVGAVEGNIAYLRPETAQLIFVDFPRIYKASRGSLPFGIAQIGKAFRNEISPRNFVFRAREFEQMEIEYFFNPETRIELKPNDTKVNVLTRDAQDKGESHTPLKISSLVNFTSEWHVYWISEVWNFLMKIGLRPENLRLRQHTKEELSHYAQDTWDVDYLFPFGWKEMIGMANRSDFDLKQHAKHSGDELKVLDGDKKIYPWVMEPSFGVDRLIMALLSDAWYIDKDSKDKRQVLRLNPKIAPIQIGVFPLVNKEGMDTAAWEIYLELSKHFRAFYDSKGSIGRRYRRQDSIGTPYCITIDGDTLKDKTVTLRERDSMDQKRIKIRSIGTKISESF